MQLTEKRKTKAHQVKLANLKQLVKIKLFKKYIFIVELAVVELVEVAILPY